MAEIEKLEEELRLKRQEIKNGILVGIQYAAAHDRMLQLIRKIRKLKK